MAYLLKYQLMTEILHETVVPVERVDENGELVYEEVPVLDEYGQPVLDEEGNPVTESKAVIDYETKQEIEQTFHACEIRCNDSNFESNYALAQREAYNGEVTVEEVEDEEKGITTEDILNAMLGVTE